MADPNTRKTVTIVDHEWLPARNDTDLALIHGAWILSPGNSLRLPDKYPCLTRGYFESDGGRSYHKVDYLYEDDVRELIAQLQDLF